MNKIKLIAITLVVLIIGVTQPLSADDKSESFQYRPLVVAVPSLNIAADARGGGMGDLGAATDPDIYSQYWNPAKYAFAYSKAGVGLSYTPWLRK